MDGQAGGQESSGQGALETQVGLASKYALCIEKQPVLNRMSSLFRGPQYPLESETEDLIRCSEPVPGLLAHCSYLRAQKILRPLATIFLLMLLQAFTGVEMLLLHLPTLFPREERLDSGGVEACLLGACAGGYLVVAGVLDLAPRRLHYALTSGVMALLLLAIGLSGTVFPKGESDILHLLFH